MTGSVTDKGNRAKLFGYDAKHLKQTLTITPSKGACMKEAITVESEGWYADLPEFTCPLKRKAQDFQMDNKCYDEVIDEVKGYITGFALKEIKKISMQGQTITVEEEVISLNKTTLADALFDAPANYTAANTLKEVQEDTGDESSSQNNVPTTPTNTSTSSFPMPAAGVETAPIGEKKAGTIRIGVVMPKVTTPPGPGSHADERGYQHKCDTDNKLREPHRGRCVENAQLLKPFHKSLCGVRL
ncbi:MAG: hypothetical protein HC846_08185 [Blastocatellia bacterium]|nr:hypothetical protein [Blastocatellia bacterium]